MWCDYTCVEYILHAAHLTDAPNSTRVSIKTAVCALICVQPTIFAFFSGLSSHARLRNAMMPGISKQTRERGKEAIVKESNIHLEALHIPCSAISISRRPNACWLMLRTQKSVLPLEFCCVFSRGDTSSSSELLPVYEAAKISTFITWFYLVLLKRIQKKMRFICAISGSKEKW